MVLSSLKEINATKKSEINPECPSIANPNYVLTSCSGVKQLEIFKTEVEREKLNLKTDTTFRVRAITMDYNN